MLARINPYVIGKGLIDPFDVAPGDMVYTINSSLRIEVMPVQSVTTEFFSGRINVVKSGQNQSLSTESSRFMYVRGDIEYETMFARWDEIPEITPNKDIQPKKFLPVLSFLDNAPRIYDDQFLDGLARRIYLGDLTWEKDRDRIRNMRGRDGIVLITLMEEYFSDVPGKGKYGRASVKDRLFYIPQRWVVDDIARLAVLSGYTAQVVDHSIGAIQVNFESTPVPGSVPKNQKYYKEPFADYVFGINANNLPILGRSLTKWCFMSTSEAKNESNT